MEDTTDRLDINELVRLINEIIGKSERDRLKDKLITFYEAYTAVLRKWARKRLKDDKQKRADDKDREIQNHLKDAKRAVERGDATGARDAISRAEDDLEELEEIVEDP